jgi:WD40 repeat protein/uncharacterized caspase-like protein
MFWALVKLIVIKRLRFFRGSTSLHFVVSCILIFFGLTDSSTFAQSTNAQPRVDYESHAARINQIRASSDFTKIVSISQDKTVRVWRASDLKQLKVIRLPSDVGEEGAPRALAITSDGESVWVGGWTGIAWRKKSQLYRFDLNTGKLLETFGSFPDAIETIAIRGKDEQIAVGLTSGGLSVFDLKSKKQLLLDTNYLERVTFLDFSVDGKLATTSLDGCVRVYDSQLKIVFRAQYPPNNSAQSESTCLGSELGGIRFSPDGQWIAFGLQNRAEVVLMDAKKLTPVRVISVKDSKQRSLCCIAWSPDSSDLFVNGTYDGSGDTPLYRIANAGSGGTERLNIGNQLFTNMLPLPGGGIVFSTNAPSLTRVDANGQKVAETKPPNADFRFKFDQWSISDDATQISIPLAVKAEKKFVFGMDFEPSIALFSDVKVPSGISNLAKGNPPNRNGRLRVETALGLRSYDNPTKVGGTTVKLKPYQQVWSWANHDSFEVAAVGTEWSVLFFGNGGKKLWETDIAVPAYQTAISKDGLWVVVALADGTIRWLKSANGEEAVGLFLHADGVDWVAWRSDGFYVSSPRGDEYLGWLINRGDQTEPDFLKASQFERQLYRPDLVRLALRNSQISNGAARSQPLTSLRAPKVSIEKVYSGRNGKISILVNAESTGSALQEVGIYVAGLPVLRSFERTLRESESNRFSRVFDIDMASYNEGLRVEVETKNSIGIDETFLQDSVITEQRKRGVDTRPFVKGKLWVIAVGIENFARVREGRQINIRDLPNAPRDVELLVAALKTQKGRAYSDVRVQTLIRKSGSVEPTAKNILLALKKLEDVAPEDTVAVFIASHGIATSGKQPEYLLVTEDTNAKELLDALNSTEPLEIGVERTFLTGSDLNAALKRVPGRRILILDTCYAGAAGSGSNPYVLAKRSAASQIAVFSAASGAEEAYESTSVAQGAFSLALSEILANNGSLDRNRSITLVDALEYVIPKVTANTIEMVAQARKKGQRVLQITQTPTLFAIPSIKTAVIAR